METEKQASQRPILVIGNSHTTAIAGARSSAERQLIDVVNLASFFDPVNRRNKVLHRELVDLFHPQRIYCTFGGSEHSVFGLLESPIRFDFMTASQSQTEPGRDIVTYGLIRATLERAMNNAQIQARELRAMFSCPITHLCTPPPFREISGDVVLPRVFHDNLHVGISPPAIRKKLYEVHSDIARKAHVAMNIGFMEVPAECADADGFLKSDYWSEDPTHGNRRYGELVIRQILGASNG